MLKTFAPKNLHGAQLGALMEHLQATPADVAKHLHVSERSVFRWIRDDSAPYAALAALWHETPLGRENSSLDVGNALAIQRQLTRANESRALDAETRLSRLIAIADTGASNDAMRAPRQEAFSQALQQGPAIPARAVGCSPSPLPAQSPRSSGRPRR